jgi:hypothetical protein
MQARLGYTTTTPHRPGKPLDAYPATVLETVRQAALADVRLIRDRIDAGRGLAGTGCDPRTGGWTSRPNVLWHIARHGPLRIEQFRHRHSVRCAPGGLGGFNAELFLTPADLPPLLAGLICLTGLERSAPRVCALTACPARRVGSSPSPTTRNAPTPAPPRPCGSATAAASPPRVGWFGWRGA